MGASIALPVVAIATASASSATTQDKVIFVQTSGERTPGPYVEYEGANGTNLSQPLSVARGSCSSSTLSNPASSVLPISAAYYADGYTQPSTSASVGSEVTDGAGETGVCVNSRTSPGYTIQPKEGLVFSVGQSSTSLTYGRLFSEATIPMKNNSSSESVSGNLVLRRISGGAETIVDVVPFTLASGRESTGDLADCPVVSTGVVPAADQFDQLEIQVNSPSRGSVSVVGPSCDNDNDKDDQAVPTFYLDSAPTITSANSTTFTAGNSGSFTVTTTGYPAPTLADAAFAASGTQSACTPSTLPSGLTFKDNGDGTATIAGTPAPSAGPDTYTFCINASNDAGTAVQTFTLTLDQPAAITSANSTAFTADSPGSFTVTTTGNPTPALTDTCASLLPSGVTFKDNGDGTATIAGTPAPITANAPNGTYAYPVCISASNTFGGTTNTATQAFSLTIDQAPAITSAAAATFTSGSAALMTTGVPGSFTVTTTGNPTPAITNAAFPSGDPTCTPSTLPDDVSFADNNNGTATITYTAADDTAGSYTLCLNATNAFGSPPTTYAATQPFTLTIDQAPAITSADNDIVPQGEAFSFEVTTSGNPTPSLSDASSDTCTTTLPSDLNFADNGDGTATINGTPGTDDAGTWTVCITASNGVGSAATQDFSLYVTSPNTPLVAMNDSSDGVTATLQINSGSKSFSDFTTHGSAGGTSTVQFTTEGTSLYTATVNIDWGDLAYCVPYASTSPPTCQPSTVTVGPPGSTAVPVLACPPGSPPTPLPVNTWCSEGATYSYVSVDGTEYTNITETIFGSGDLTFGHT
ncbi:MAG: putative Ig domain-containing protein [Acidimicrobiales bacterium]